MTLARTATLLALVALAAAGLLVALPMAAPGLSAAAVVLAHARSSTAHATVAAIQPAPSATDAANGAVGDARDAAPHYFHTAGASTRQALDQSGGRAQAGAVPRPFRAGLDAQALHPLAAAAQVDAIAAARGLAPADLHALITWSTDRPLTLFGEPSVNLAMLNLALDDLDARAND